MTTASQSVACWMLTKADADEERARIIQGREPFLAKLLIDEARQARQLVDLMQREEGQ